MPEALVLKQLTKCYFNFLLLPAFSHQNNKKLIFMPIKNPRSGRGILSVPISHPLRPKPLRVKD
jgi:hypothetical protein